MPWTMDINPLGSLALSALVAAVPILYLFWALAYKRMKGHWAAISAVAIAVLISIIAYGMPVNLSVLSIFNGFLFGLWPVCWIVVTAVYIYNLSVETKQFEIIKNSLAAISDDRRVQAVIIAYSFGAFLEGAAGFGTPVAISAAMLAGLGFNPIYAAGICLIANTAPVAFGAIGIPIVVAAGVSGVDMMAISKMVGRQLPFFSIIVPFYMAVVMAGWKKAVEIWPILLVSGGSFALTQFLVSNYIGPYLPDILSAIVSIIATVIFAKIWHPKESWTFEHEAAAVGRAKLEFTAGQVFRAWAPFILLSIFVAAWGVKPVKAALDQIATLKFPIAGLDKAVIDHLGKPKAAVYAFNILSAAGTAILFAGILSIPVMGASIGTALRVAGKTLNQLKWPIVTIGTILGFAYLYNFSGMAITLGYAFASTGIIFPFFAAFLGWLGVFMTGSDTSSNALFGKLQEVTARQIGIDPVLTVATNSSGGVFGKMISPQSIAVATAATGYVGHEGDIFRFTLKHSIILTFIMGVLAMLQAYVFTWMIPQWEQVVQAAVQATKAAAPVNIQEGINYLIATFAISLFIVILSRIIGKGVVK
ncbi:L-lactate permease [Thermodesulfovibrio yellowstonii]|uniref:L-lactate permease n=3 Tax=Thermodesulfovibrio yellowstonii TaxID=28262 RepID=B5YJU6_THEYD|nr:lactate permease LctP family transporter [Thermodesulfovibrio yellowstonii]ACI21502.1 glycolate permease GlcA [Thermodesulfovibrio yellowstonii DSM 11347]